MIWLQLGHYRHATTMYPGFQRRPRNYRKIGMMLRRLLLSQMIQKTGDNSEHSGTLLPANQDLTKQHGKKEKLDDKENSSTDIWKCVKGWLG